MGLASKLSKIVTPTKKKASVQPEVSIESIPPKTVDVLPKKESSKNFKTKFKNTVVVDENKKPALLYHGRTNDYEAFDPMGGSSSVPELGTHLGTQAQANEFATYAGGNIVPAYVDIKNPLRLEDRGGFQPTEVLEQLRGYGISDEVANQIEDLPVPEQVKAVSALIKDMGYDGIVYLNKREGLNLKGTPKQVADKLDEIQDYDDDVLRKKYGAQDSYIILDPTQAKSPFNSGTYSETDDRFNYNKGGAVNTTTDYTIDQPADTGGIQHGTITEPQQPTMQPLMTPRFAMAKGGQVANQTQRMLKEGGMMQEGGTVDPESGNKVPVGAMQEEVRDDIPAQLSEGEFVFPADVVRYIGLERLMMMRQAAKKGLMQMDDMGQMSNGEEGSEEEDTAEFESQIDEIIGELGGREPEEKESETKMAEGGMVAPPMQAPAASPPMAAPAPAAMPPQSAPPAPPPEGVAPSAASEQTNAALAPTSDQPTARGNPEVDALIAQSMEADQLTDAEKQAMAGFLRSEPAQLAITLRESNSLFLCLGLSKTELAVTVFTTDSPEILNESVGKFLGAVKTAKIKSLQGATKNPNLIAAFEANSIKPITKEENGIISYKVKVSEFKPQLG
jgi:hypothetical protein